MGHARLNLLGVKPGARQRWTLSLAGVNAGSLVVEGRIALQQCAADAAELIRGLSRPLRMSHFEVRPSAGPAVHTFSDASMCRSGACRIERPLLSPAAGRSSESMPTSADPRGACGGSATRNALALGSSCLREAALCASKTPHTRGARSAEPELAEWRHIQARGPWHHQGLALHALSAADDMDRRQGSGAALGHGALPCDYECRAGAVMRAPRASASAVQEPNACHKITLARWKGKVCSIWLRLFVPEDGTTRYLAQKFLSFDTTADIGANFGF